MGDKQRSEIQKPVKNTLLSGASHGFPFENFQGSSLLIPVSQDSPSVLNDSIGDVSKSISKEFTRPQNTVECTVSTTTFDCTPSTTESGETKNIPATASYGYTGIFSSFFGGIQKKQDTELDHNKSTNADENSASPLHPPSQSSSFVTIPTIQSFSPALHVPAAVTEHVQNDSLPTSTKASLSSETFIINSQNQGSPSFDTLTSSSKTVTALQNPTVLPESHVSFEKSKTQVFYNNENVGKTDLSQANQTHEAGIGFEPFSAPESAVLTKAQSAIGLVGGFNENLLRESTLFSNSVKSNSPAPQIPQTRTGSVDSIKSFQPPLISGSSLSTPLAAPPISSGVSARNYRRDHHKRLAYAPVPGLTSNRTVSSSYLSSCENFSAPIPALTSYSDGVKPPLTGSLSQPTLNSSNLNLNSSPNLSTSNLSTSTHSISNFFSSHSTAVSTGSFQSEVPKSNVDFLSSGTTLSFFDHNSSPQAFNNQNFSSALNFTCQDNQASVDHATRPPESSPHIVTPHNVHPPIMSTREQMPSHISKTHSERSSSPIVIPPSLNNLANLGTSGIIYRPVYHHWFIKSEVKDSKEIWQPFSMTDSLALEQAFTSDSLTPGTVIPTDGGRYDVNITNRTRTAVYWEEEPKTVRRCSWFFKSTTESRLHPYDENTAYNLEEEYKKAVTTNTWSRRVELPTGDSVMMYGPSSMALFQDAPQTPEGWEAETDYTQTEQRRPKIVKRGVLDDFDIEEGESTVVDHLIFVVHGIGSVCDFKFRTIEEAVNGFRTKSLQLIKSHFRTSMDEGAVNRVEILPVSWHSHLHGENTGVDKKLQTITLKSIPRLRHFTNDTLLDILFYTSPVYCQNIVQQVGREVNTLFAKFKARNPNFTGGVSLVGHSLGSLILFDTLCHQKPPSPSMNQIQEEVKETVIQHEITPVVSSDKKKRSLSRNVSYVIGNAGTGQPFIEYPQLHFQPLAFFAMGSPIGMFVTVRGIDSLGLDFCLPTCSRFYNIFHPFDPVAYRIEALINPDLAEKRPVLIPHHKGRKRMHLELKETMARVGADLKQRLVDSVRSTWNTVYQLTMFGRADDGLEQEVDQVIEKQLERQRAESVGSSIETEEADFDAGRLNQGRRIDYVLQEAPLESFNEYVSALTSHVIYWDSEDTILLILKEIYGSMGISADSQTSIIHGIQEAPFPVMNDQNNMPSTSAQDRQPPSYGFK